MKLPFPSIRLREWRDASRTADSPAIRPMGVRTRPAAPLVDPAELPWYLQDPETSAPASAPSEPAQTTGGAGARAPTNGVAPTKAPARRRRPSPSTAPAPVPTPAPAPAPGPPLISLRDVGRRYGGAVSVTALEHATLEIRGGEFVVVLGPSGSGKTTLLNLIGALDQASEGELIVGGRDLSRASRGELARFRRESVTFIFQTFNLFPALTALENVEFGASVARRRKAGAAAAAMLERVGLGHRLRHFPHSLSGGEQQRVAIARALATDNPIVLADEPTGELDFRTGLQILELLQEQALAGRAVIVVTHNREIARVADRVVELSSGRIVSDRRIEGDRPALADLHW